MTMYFLPPGYRENPVKYFIDDVTQDRGIVFQPDVYGMAELLAEMSGRETIVDVGCGRADKLVAIDQRHPRWTFHGIDHGDNIKWCQENRDFGVWTEHDLETPMRFGSSPVIVCSDVIEHLAHPEILLRSLAESGALCILSTPERTATYGTTQFGPPHNICHVREWTIDELNALLLDAGFMVHWIGLTRSSDIDYSCKTTLAIIQG